MQAVKKKEDVDGLINSWLGSESEKDKGNKPKVENEQVQVRQGRLGLGATAEPIKSALSEATEKNLKRKIKQTNEKRKEKDKGVKEVEDNFSSDDEEDSKTNQVSKKSRPVSSSAKSNNLIPKSKKKKGKSTSEVKPEKKPADLNGKLRYHFEPTEVGTEGTFDHKIYIYKNKQPISAFHDINFWFEKKSGIAHMLVEIPKGTQAKMEINKEEFLNPIKQDVKNGKLRNVAIPYPFNYGAFPQTWENPAFVDPDTKAKGDNDPVDVVELSETVAFIGEVKRVKILGVYAMIDEGETDWKVLAIDMNDPLASKLNDLDDIETVLPGKLEEVFTFLRDYKVPDGKPQNQFAFGGQPKNKEFTMKVVEKAHKEWSKLIRGESTTGKNDKEQQSDNVATISKANLLWNHSPFKITKEEALSKMSPVIDKQEQK